MVAIDILNQASSNGYLETLVATLLYVEEFILIKKHKVYVVCTFCEVIVLVKTV